MRRIVIKIYIYTNTYLRPKLMPEKMEDIKYFRY